jgi:hypothetical protein
MAVTIEAVGLQACGEGAVQAYSPTEASLCRRVTSAMDNGVGIHGECDYSRSPHTHTFSFINKWAIKCYSVADETA